MEAREAQEASNKEEWREIPGYAGLYEASNLGRIRSVDRVTIGADGIRRKYKGKILKVWTDGDGYRKTKLSRNGERISYYVHRLAWIAFAGPIPEGFHVDHIDNDPANNRIGNLQALTPKENAARKKLFGTSPADMVANGEHYQTRKSQCPNGHPHFSDNNKTSAAKRGARECLICSRAYGYLLRYPDFPESMKWAVYDMQTERLLLES